VLLDPEAPETHGNVESLLASLSKDSIIVWHFKSFKRKQRRMRQWKADPDKPPVLLFATPKAVANWLRSLPAPNATRSDPASR